jgi:predicted DNA-binding protein
MEKKKVGRPREYNESVVMAVRIEKQLKDKLETLAKNDNRTLSNFITTSLERIFNV